MICPSLRYNDGKICKLLMWHIFCQIPTIALGKQKQNMWTKKLFVNFCTNIGFSLFWYVYMLVYLNGCHSIMLLFRKDNARALFINVFCHLNVLLFMYLLDHQNECSVTWVVHSRLYTYEYFINLLHKIKLNL